MSSFLWRRQDRTNVRAARKAFPVVERLEDRAVPATNLSATLIGSTVVFQDLVGGDDILILWRDAQGLLQHNQVQEGALGFESAADLDSVTPGVQSRQVADLLSIEVDTGLGNDRVTVDDMGRTPSALDVDLVGVEKVAINTGRRADLVSIGAHNGHLDVDMGGKEFHIAGATELALDTLRGADRVTVNDLGGAIVPENIVIGNAKIVTFLTGSGDDDVVLGTQGGDLGVELDGVQFQVSQARKLVLDTQNGDDSVTVANLSEARVPKDIDLVNAESVQIQTSSGTDKVALRAHRGHLDVEFARQNLHVAGAEAFLLDTQGGVDTVKIGDLSGVADLGDVFLEDAERATLNTGRGDDEVTLDAHDDSLEVALSDRAFHVDAAEELRINTQGGDDQFLVNDLDAIAPPELTLDGGRGDDVYRIATTTAALKIEDHSGTDTLDFSSFGSSGVTIDLSTRRIQDIGASVSLTLRGALDNVIGSAYADVIFGNGASNAIDGREGDDTLHGRGGNDLLAGDAGDDVLFGERGNDWLLGGVGADTLDDGPGIDFLSDPDDPV